MLRTLAKSLTLPLTFVVGVACGDLGAALDEQECYSEADCGPLSCVVSSPLIDGANVNAAGLGWCVEGSTCVIGSQPYCPCALPPNDLCTPPSYNSGRVVSATAACWTSDKDDDGQIDPDECLCVPSDMVPMACLEPPP